MHVSCQIVHVTRGRVRLRVNDRGLLAAKSTALTEALASVVGVSDVRINVACRSMIVHFDARRLNAEFLLERLSLVCRIHAGEREKQPAASSHQAVGPEVSQTTSVTNGKRFHLPAAQAAVSRASAAGATGSRSATARHLSTSNFPLHEALPPPGADWHVLSREDVLSHWQTSARVGLDEGEAQRRLTAYGSNTLPTSQPRSMWAILGDQLNTLPVAMLLGSAVLSAFTGGLADAGVILAVVGVNALIGHLSESESERTLAALLSEQQPSSTVVRGGVRRTLTPSEVVPGDLLMLGPGTHIAADARLVRTEHLLVDESTLTGESLPVPKNAQLSGDADTPLRERTNMVYRGTAVTGGSAEAVVISTGSHTEVGRIQGQIAEGQRPETPVQRQLRQLGTTLAVASGAICAGVFGVGVVRGFTLLQMLKATSALAVAAVPEGLPMVATTTLALGVQRMKRQRVVVRRLDAVETLGSVQVFCLDKTGTLTRNRMTAQRMLVGRQTLRVEQHGIYTEGDERRVDAWNLPELKRLLETIALCNETTLLRQGADVRLEGSPTETALMQLAREGGIDVGRLRRRYELLGTGYRTEARTYMTTRHGTPGGDVRLAVKGRPSDLLQLCRWRRQGRMRVPLDDADRAHIEAENDRLAGLALRVLGVAEAQGPEPPEPDDGDLTWLGLVGIADPVRPGVSALIETLHHAGIRTTMITGDQSATAYAIAQQLHLSADHVLEMLDSQRLEQLDADVLKSLAQRVHVFSAVTPSHKLQIVQALQRAGLVVAMTGDGINDGPALKAADVGVAMGGRRAADVAQLTADVVLRDNRLETMINAIRQGRAIYDDTRKAIQYLLATNLSEILVMFSAIAAGAGQPLTPIQLLWINLVSDVAPVFALALQPPEDDILERPPRDPHEPFLGWPELRRVGVHAAVITAGGLASYAWGVGRYGVGPRARTLGFLSLTAAQLLHILCARSPEHSLFSRHAPPTGRLVWYALLGGLALTLAPLGVPVLRRLVGLAPITPADAVVALLGAVVPLAVNEGLKFAGTSTIVSGEPHLESHEAPSTDLPVIKLEEAST